MAQWVKNLPAVQETQQTRVWSLDWEDPLEKEMAAHSSTLAWRIPWAEEQDSPWNRRESDTIVQLTYTFTFMLIIQAHKRRCEKLKQIIKLNLIIYRRKWQPTPVFLPGESQGWRSLVGCRL